MSTPYPFGFDGAIAAQHNLLVGLGAQFPSADSLIAIVRAQRLVSTLVTRAAEVVNANDLAIQFATRAENYQRLLGMLMGRVAGVLGRGQGAVVDAKAVQRAMEDAVGTGERVSGDQLAWLRRLFTMTDACVAARVKQGIDQRRYFVWNELSLSGVGLGGVRRAVRKYEPIGGRNHPNLFAALKALAPDGEPLRFVEGSPRRDEFTKAVETGGELDRAHRYGGQRVIRPDALGRGQHEHARLAL